VGGPGQEYRVAAGRYEFPAGWEEVRNIVAFHGIRAGIVPSVCYCLELRDAGVLDDLRSTLLGRAPRFDRNCPRITVA
jgi:hypothetical protein